MPRQKPSNPSSTPSRIGAPTTNPTRRISKTNTCGFVFFSKYSEMGIFSKKSSENSEIGIFIQFLRENSEIEIFSAKFIQIFRNGNFCFADILPTKKNRLLLEVQKTSCFNLFLFCFYSLCKNALGVLLAITACVKTLFVFLVKLALHCLRATFLANSWCWSFSICMSGRAWLPLQRLLCPSVRLHVLLFRSCRRWTW